MSEQEDALDDLGRAGVLRGICWAWQAATRQVLEDYDPFVGHNQAWIGYTAHILFSDRLDRVFSCDRFALAANADPSSGVDLVRAGLSTDDRDTMPELAPRLVERADLNGSPGWRLREWRWLLASYACGKSDRIPWPQKRPTKRRVAAQRSPDEITLFDEEEFLCFNEVALRAAKSAELDLATLVAVHAIDGTTGQSELFFGRTKLNTGGGYAWHWKVELIGTPPGSDGGRTSVPQSPIGPNPNALPDAPVKIRAVAADKSLRQDGSS